MIDLHSLPAAQRARILLLRGLMSEIHVCKPKRIGIGLLSCRVPFSARRLEALYYAWLRDGDSALVDRRSLTKSLK